MGRICQLCSMYEVAFQGAWDDGFPSELTLTTKRERSRVFKVGAGFVKTADRHHLKGHVF